MLAARLRALRDEAGLSQGQLAKYAGVAQSSYSEIERGVIEPRTLDAVVRLAQYFEVSTDFLLGLTDDPTPPGRGEAPPAHGEELLDILRRLGPLQGERLLAMAQGLLQYHEERLRNTRERIQVLDTLSDRYGPERAGLLEDLAVEAVAAGLPDAAILYLLDLATTVPPQE